MRNIFSSAYDDVGHKSISAITRKLIKLRDYLNKEFPMKERLNRDLLAKLTELAIEIDDPRLHIMMLRLGLYDVPASERVERIKELEKEIKKGKSDERK